MVQGIDLTAISLGDGQKPASLRWSLGASVTRRILAVNIFALGLMAASIFYLDSYRIQLTRTHQSESGAQALLIANALDAAPTLRCNPQTLKRFAYISHTRIRVIDMDGRILCSSWPDYHQSYGFHNPLQEQWGVKAARFLDRLFDALVFAPKLSGFTDDVPRVAPTALQTHIQYAPDRTVMISAFAPLKSGYVITTENAREITETVRDERLRLVLLVAGVMAVSIALSLFLGRTIVLPLRMLARAALRVRLGGARDVTVPRLPERVDEIGLLARSLSDMTQTLRARIDASEAFAADVAHELKNPLASLRAAVDALELVQATELKAQLLGVVRADVRRLDRLITDIADLSRLDAQMTRVAFTRIDFVALVQRCTTQGCVPAMESSNVSIQLMPFLGSSAIILGDVGQLERMIGNLMANARSFAPAGSAIQTGVFNAQGYSHFWVEDQGPGVPKAARDRIFDRFHSDRSDADTAPNHSGLGLAIVRTIVDAHQGKVHVTDRADGHTGARFVVALPLAEVGA